MADNSAESMLTKLERELHRSIGIIPELKHSTYFRSIGLPLEELLFFVVVPTCALLAFEAAL